MLKANDKVIDISDMVLSRECNQRTKEEEMFILNGVLEDIHDSLAKQELNHACKIIRKCMIETYSQM